MRFIMMDDEARDLLEAAAEMAHAALAARAKRRDPDEIISRSVEMSRIKVADVIRQLQLPALGAWGTLTAEDQKQVLDVMRLFIEVETIHERNELWKIIRSFTIRRFERDPATCEVTRELSMGVPSPVVEEDAALGASKPGKVRRVRRKGRTPTPSP